MKTAKRIMLMLSITALLCCLLSVAAFAAGSGDVAGAVESTWTAASGQIKSVRPIILSATPYTIQLPLLPEPSDRNPGH